MKGLRTYIHGISSLITFPIYSLKRLIVILQYSHGSSRDEVEPNRRPSLKLLHLFERNFSTEPFANKIQC